MGSCSQETEHWGTLKLTEIAEFQRNIDAALGEDISAPILLTTDNSANQLVSNGESSAARTKHLLRRYMVIQQAVQSGHVVVRHIDTNENPTNFLTKWVGKEEFQQAKEYVQNISSRVHKTDPAFYASENKKLREAFDAAYARIKANNT